MRVILSETGALEASLRKFLPNLIRVRISRWVGGKKDGDGLAVEGSDLDLEDADEEGVYRAWWQGIRDAITEDRKGDKVGRICYKLWLYGASETSEEKKDLAYPRIFCDLIGEDVPLMAPSVAPSAQLDPIPEVEAPSLRISVLEFATEVSISARFAQQEQTRSWATTMRAQQQTYEGIIAQKDRQIHELTQYNEVLRRHNQEDRANHTQEIGTHLAAREEVILKAEKIRAGTQIGVRLIDGAKEAAMAAMGAAGIDPELRELVQSLEPETIAFLKQEKTRKFLKNNESQAAMRIAFTDLVDQYEKLLKEEEENKKNGGNS